MTNIIAAILSLSLALSPLFPVTPIQEMSSLVNDGSDSKQPALYVVVDVDGVSHDLHTLADTSPVVIVFYRGFD